MTPKNAWNKYNSILIEAIGEFEASELNELLTIIAHHYNGSVSQYFTSACIQTIQSELLQKLHTARKMKDWSNDVYALLDLVSTIECNLLSLEEQKRNSAWGELDNLFYNHRLVSEKNFDRYVDMYMKDEIGHEESIWQDLNPMIVAKQDNNVDLYQTLKNDFIEAYC